MGGKWCAKWGVVQEGESDVGTEKGCIVDTAYFLSLAPSGRKYWGVPITGVETPVFMPLLLRSRGIAHFLSVSLPFTDPLLYV
mgnify:CR=1 FL=1